MEKESELGSELIFSAREEAGREPLMQTLSVSSRVRKLNKTLALLIGYQSDYILSHTKHLAVELHARA